MCSIYQLLNPHTGSPHLLYGKRKYLVNVYDIWPYRQTYNSAPGTFGELRRQDGESPSPAPAIG